MSGGVRCAVYGVSP